MFHSCDPECKEYKDKDCFFDKWIIGEWKFRRCPKQYVTEDMSLWLHAYRMLKYGLLPAPGGWLAQTNKFMLVMSLIENELAKEEEPKGKQDGRK